MERADDIVWFEFVESKVFSKQTGALPAEVLINIQSDLVQNPQRGDIVKGTHGVRKARVADPARREARAVATDICISTSNTPAEFICYIYSAKVTKPTYHRIKRASLAR
ncbi:MAG TPA: hypothetical protein VN644_02895 [Pyrinomonadaceae bacterium]|nr:hypothetical protein [Pyrinomonadaceae bacterium]